MNGASERNGAGKINLGHKPMVIVISFYDDFFVSILIRKTTPLLLKGKSSSFCKECQCKETNQASVAAKSKETYKVRKWFKH